MAEPSRTLYSEELVTDLFSKVRGKSALAALCGQEGMPFTGTEQFTFNMPQEVDIVAENGAFSHGGVEFDPVTIVPIKFEYGARLPREFVDASEEKKVAYTESFNNGFAAKLAKGMDIAAMHGFNPRTNTASAVVGSNHFDAKVTQHVDYVAATVDENLDDAIATIADGDVTGIAMSKTFASNMSKITNGTNGPIVYPEFKFGGTPAYLNGIPLAVNATVSKGPATYPDHAIVGDFANAFQWGFGKDVMLETIEYGDPDGTGVDLKNKDQIYLRGIAHIGWGILAPEYFCRVVTPSL